MKIAIKVDHSNCYLLDGIIEQYGLRWAAYELSVRKLEETSVMNNYLVIDLETKTLQWTECNPYEEVSIFSLIDNLNATRKPAISLPVYQAGRRLFGADKDYICTLADATEAEIAFIVTKLNKELK